jgi:N-acylneuraminate cytidylyltransferase
MIMNIVAIIPARGGSKRIPHKSTRLLAGKPLIAHTIEHACKSVLIDRVVVSTDSESIANVSKEYGAEVLMRPDDISGDKATSESALVHALDKLKEKDGYEPDIVVFLQCTSPIRNDDDIDNAINVFIDTEADSLLSVCKFDKFIWKPDNGSMAPINYDYRKRCREQDFPTQYMENGSMYIFKPWVINLLDNRLGGNIMVYEMEWMNSFQIDSVEDLELCKLLLERGDIDD